MIAGAEFSRRDFFQVLGGGIVVLMGAGPPGSPAADAGPLYPSDFNAYLLIGNDGRVTVYSGKIEMGQGVMTSQAQMVAEELRVPLDVIDMVLGDTDRCPPDMGTFGSLTTRMFGPYLRAAAARARLTLATLGAERLGVPVSGLVLENGVVSVAAAPARRVSYAELSQGARIAERVDANAALRAAADFDVMGRSAPRLDGVAKVTGAAHYAADVRLPGMRYACLLRPPVHGATLLSVDTAIAAARPGITLVARDGLTAVLHADPEAAARACAEIKAEWRLPEARVDPDTIHDRLVAEAEPARTIVARGALPAAAGGSRLERRYLKGYVAHAPLEPHAALAVVRDGKATVWASTQTPFPTRERVAAALSLAPQAVRVITPFLGGGFGGKSADRQAVEAARLAQISGVPVQVAWSRGEEFFYDTFDPACVVDVAATLAGGRIDSWDYIVYAAGERGATLAYDVPNVRIRASGAPAYGQTAQSGAHPFAVGPWRGPGANMNVFATEATIDALAAAAGVDPLEFRLRHLSDARMRRVLGTVADAFGWQSAARPSHRGVGLACSIDAGTYVATAAEVSVDASSGAIQVKRIVCAQDMGIVVNPDGARMQIEGGITMGLGYALTEELRFHGGAVLDHNFDSYRIPRFTAVPHITALLVPNPDTPPQGGGEPAVTTMGAALANAVFDATGVQLRRLPMTPARVLAALRGR